MSSLAGSVASLASGADWDPDRLLRGWLGSMQVPVWASEKDAADCSHCHAKFETSLLMRSLESHKHNCRLCGQVFCSRCTSKYYLPSEWDPKGKTGAMRVCYSCAERVLQRKRDLTRNENSTLLVPSMAGESLNAITIHPPQWESKESAGACWKCHSSNKKGRSHNCRTCGRVACSDCSVKMDVPSAFKKKNKPGDARVCDFCRYLKEGGCSFSESKAPERPPLVSKKSSAAADALSVLSPRSKTALMNAIKPAEAPKVEEDSDDDDDGVQYAPREVSTASPSPESPRRPDLRVFWEGLDTPLATMPPTAYSQETSLVQIHAALVFQKPSMKDKQFTYVFRKKPVFPEHWDIFTVKFLGENIYIRSEEKETVEMPLHPLVSVVTEAAGEIQSALTARALFEYNAQDSTQLSFKKGDSFTLLDHSDAQWWYVLLQRTKARGWIPASFVEKSEFKAAVEKPATAAVAAAPAAPLIVTPATEEIIAPTPACELVTPAPAPSAVSTPAPPSTASAAPAAPRIIPPPPGSKSSSGQRGSLLPPPPAQQRSSLISGSAAVTVGSGGVDDLLKARAKMFARK